MVVDLSFSELMARANDLLGHKVDYYQPDRYFWSFNILIPSDYKLILERGLENSGTIEHLFGEAVWHSEILPPHGTESLPDSPQIDEGVKVAPSYPGNVTEPYSLLPLISKIRVFHGHTIEELCFTSYFCHVENYRPTGSESPQFIRYFYERWPYAKLK